MFKAKHKVSLFAACLTLLLTMVLGLAGIFSIPSTTTASAATAYTETSFGEGKFLITTTYNGSTYYLPATTTTSKAPVATKFTDVTSISEDHLWTVTATGNNYYIQNADGKYLYTTSTNNGVRVSTTQNAWKYDTKNNSLMDTKTNRYLGIYNAQDWRCYTSVTQSNYKESSKSFKFYQVSTAPSCTHDGETEWTYDSSKKQHYEKCLTCEKEIENTRTACADFEYSDYTTASGKHTRTATCTVCGGTQTESGDCEVVASDYVREGNKHYQTGTCQVCGDETTVWENCTLGYVYASNNDETHNEISTCSVCGQSATAENVDCTFDEGVLDGTTLTYTCDYCAYSYTEEATVYTVSFVVPNGIEEVEAIPVAENFTTKLPDAGTVEGYTFTGWVEATLDEKTEVAPTYYESGAEYKVTEDITLYALYTYSEGTGNWKKVTTDLSNTGTYLIVYESGTNAYIFNAKEAASNYVSASTDGEWITNSSEIQNESVTIAAMNGGYSILTKSGYIYGTSGTNKLSFNSSTAQANTITIASNGEATIISNTSHLRFNPSTDNLRFRYFKSSSYTSQKLVYLYALDGATYYVTAFNTCAHTNVNEVLEKATCLTSGFRTVTCLDCEAELVSEILPALGHNFVDNVCENCGNVDPASIVYNGFYYLSVNGKYAGEKDGKYYKLFDYTPGETAEANYVFYFVQNGETYDMYNLKAGLIQAGVTLATQENYSVHITNSEGKILSHNTTYADYQRLGFFATSNSWPCDIILTEVELNANIDSASITVGESLTLNYYVSMDAALAEKAKLYVTVGNGEEEEFSYTTEGGRYKFSLAVPPQCMADTIVAVLKNGSLVLDTEEYSIQTYAQNKLNDSESSTELKQLLTDMLYYGAESQKYMEYNTGKLATDGVENLGDPSTVELVAPEFTAVPVSNTEVESYPVYFKNAKVWFGDVNKIYIQVNAIEGATLSVNNGEAVALTSHTIEVTLLATQFDEVFTFALYHDGVLMQTLTYSVNAYAYKMQKNEKMADLAKALYNYGVSADAYAATIA